MAGFFSQSPEQISILAAVLGIVISENLNLEEQNSLGNFIESVGQIILTFNAQQQLLESKKAQEEKIKQLTCQVELLSNQMQQIKQNLKRK